MPNLKFRILFSLQNSQGQSVNKKHSIKFTILRSTSKPTIYAFLALKSHIYLNLALLSGYGSMVLPVSVGFFMSPFFHTSKLCLI